MAIIVVRPRGVNSSQLHPYMHNRGLCHSRCWVCAKLKRSKRKR